MHPGDRKTNPGDRLKEPDVKQKNQPGGNDFDPMFDDYHPVMTISRACDFLGIENNHENRRWLKRYIEAKEEETGVSIFVRNGRNHPVITPSIIEENLPELLETRISRIANMIRKRHKRQLDPD